MKRTALAVVLTVVSWQASAGDLASELRASAKCHINTFNHQECEYKISGFRAVIAGIGTALPGIHFEEVDPAAHLQVTTGIRDVCVMVSRYGNGVSFDSAFISPNTGGVYDESTAPECFRRVVNPQ